MTRSHYIIRGGVEGRERLRILSRVMQDTTLDLLKRAGLKSGMSCLEVACGGGDVAFDMARIVGSSGRITATDIDAEKLNLARGEAKAQNLDNIEFLQGDIVRQAAQGKFDLVHARFLLTHLPDPKAALANMRTALKPGGVIVIEDIDVSGCVSYPHSPALSRFVELYSSTVRVRGGDACIGPRLPGMLIEAGFTQVEVKIVQPAGIEGEVKLIAPITMENIADAVMAEGLATETEIGEIARALYDYARTPGTLACLPRVVGTWGRN
jgi:ubiquinone/menaquinone biosynthesis C-methylase UbiE